MTDLMKHLPIRQVFMLNPDELIAILKYFVQMGDIWHLQVAAMTLFSCSAYLRNKKMKTIKFEHIRFDLSAISPVGVITGIMLQLHDGKTDEEPQLQYYEGMIMLCTWISFGC